MGRLIVTFLRCIPPHRRLVIAAYLFWLSILGALISTLLLAQRSYERVLMAISWAAITLTAVDVILTADVRDDADEGEHGASE